LAVAVASALALSGSSAGALVHHNHAQRAAADLRRDGHVPVHVVEVRAAGMIGRNCPVVAEA
jgi:hypothetical protein